VAGVKLSIPPILSPAPGPVAGEYEVRQAGLRRVPAGAREVADEMQRIVGVQATWAPSGRLSGTSFERWVAAPVEESAPDLNYKSTTMNCWEMVLLAAYQANALTWSWLHDLYENLSDAKLMLGLAPHGLTELRPLDPASPRPARGDVVIWDDASHVALAAGERDKSGQELVYSFWPENRPIAFTLDRVKVATIAGQTEALYDSFNDPPVVRFGPGPWAGGPALEVG
jgi:hypothetical protein